MPTREGETFVLVSGPENAPALVLLHGSGSNAAMWRDDVESWSKDSGCTRSTDRRARLGSDAYALWLDDVLGGLGLDKVSIVGARTRLRHAAPTAG
ncbi:alpha/beta hydrolase [Amycolatopsis sp.]|uniref:alpha/beta fold hydrolase n=1 Tax=Amycolatopsis sp. TaxID=37632 RepID=UPI002C69B887|nr:alpha/beta hydrolase [Amycolatopsis sp.]HVV10439.1 alpha/beta hydrolase [Amycolatopsis sp.]